MTGTSDSKSLANGNMSLNEDLQESITTDVRMKYAEGDNSLEDLCESRNEQGCTIEAPTVQNQTGNNMETASHVLLHETAAESAPILPLQEGWQVDSTRAYPVVNIPVAQTTFLSMPSNIVDNEELIHPHIFHQSKWPEHFPSGVGPQLPPWNSQGNNSPTRNENFENPDTTCVDDIGESAFQSGKEDIKDLERCAGSSTFAENLQTQIVVSQQLNKLIPDKFQQQQSARIDILSLDVVDSPLQKDGRHTIICGRLPDNHPYAIAARSLGRFLISTRYSGLQECVSETDRRQNFLKDWRAFHEELLGYIPKLPVIGGGELDIYSLVHEVLLLGGVLNVVKKRAFRVVAQQLELPKSCTSAASVLKNAYEKLLFYYEEKLVHNRMPQDVTRKLDMKRMALEEKEKERRAAERLARMTASRKRSGVNDLLLDVGDCTDLVDNGYLDRGDPRLKRIMLAVSDRPRETLQYLDLIIGSDVEDLLVPELEDMTEDDGSFRIVLHDVIQMDEHEQIESGADVVLLAIAECMKPSSLGLDPDFERPKDLGLGRALCILPFCSANMKRALGLLISTIVKASKTPSLLQLDDRNSTHGLIDGMFYLLHRYIRNDSNDDDEYEACEDDVFCAAFCALNVIQILLDDEQNRSKVIANVGFRHSVGQFLGCGDCNRSFLLVTLDIITKCCTLMVDVLGEQDMDVFIRSLVKRLEIATELDPEAPLEREVEKVLEVPPDYEVSSKILPILVTLARRTGIKARNCGRLMELCVRLLHCQERIADNTSLALIVHTLAERFPSMIANNRDFVRGVLKLVRDTTCVDIAAETLIMINRVWSVRELLLESGLFSGWNQSAADQDTSLNHLVESVNHKIDEGDENESLANSMEENDVHGGEEGATEPEFVRKEDDENDEEQSLDTSLQEGPTDAE